MDVGGGAVDQDFAGVLGLVADQDLRQLGAPGADQAIEAEDLAAVQRKTDVVESARLETMSLASSTGSSQRLMSVPSELCAHRGRSSS